MTGARKGIGMPGIVACACVLAALVATAAAQGASWTLPAETLDGRALVVPDDLPDRPALLIVGFTREAAIETSGWYRAIAQDGVVGQAASIHQVAILEDVPKPFRRFVIGGIRKDVPQALHGRFVLVVERSGAWKTLVSYAGRDAAYVLLLDRQRRIAWRGEGKVDAAALQSLRSEVENLRRSP